MSSTYKNAKKPLALFVFLLIIVTACASQPTITKTLETTATQAEDPSGLSSDVDKTLHSLEKLNNYPFYVMHYIGKYDYPRIQASLPGQVDISCSLFAALSESGDMFYGRNFDWDPSPALLLFTDPPDGYASASMVDLTFLGITPAEAQKLTNLPLKDRQALLAAPSMPFDGMNEYGLTVAMAAVPDEYLDDASIDPSRQTIGSIGIIRQVLDHARSVDEAIKLFSQYNIDFSGGPPIHYLLADPSGKAVLIEFYQGEMIQLPNKNPWHMATNHLRCIAQGDAGCVRYKTLSEQLTALHGQLEAESAMQLLSRVKQASTQWSSVYNMTSGDIAVAISATYKPIYFFHLELIQPFGLVESTLDDMFQFLPFKLNLRHHP